MAHLAHPHVLHANLTTLHVAQWLNTVSVLHVYTPNLYVHIPLLESQDPKKIACAVDSFSRYHAECAAHAGPEQDAGRQNLAAIPASHRSPSVSVGWDTSESGQRPETNISAAKVQGIVARECSEY
jgi:hypothetical protein